MFADVDLARRLELAEARLTADIGRAVRHGGRAADVLVHELTEGVAVFAGPGSPANKLIGAGFGGPIDETALAAIEQAFVRRQTPLHVEISTLAHRENFELLTRRGYRLAGFENVLGLPLSRPAGEEPGRISRTAVHIDAIAEEEGAAWLDAVTAGFLHADGPVGGAPIESFPREALETIFLDLAATARFRRYLARVGGQVAGGASMRLEAGVAQLCGAATLPAWRRRGVQAALLARRLADAADAACDVAVVTTQPGTQSQRNAQRQGFAVLYARAVLIRTFGA
jgi:GNAT superfamily N-acetyltransferase